jgi:hypothetical protein
MSDGKSSFGGRHVQVARMRTSPDVAESVPIWIKYWVYRCASMDTLAAAPGVAASHAKFRSFAPGGDGS